MQPNLDDGCSTSKVWLDHLRIRAAALRNAYADLNAAAPAASRLTLQIGAPTLSQPKYAGTLGQVGCPRYFLHTAPVLQIQARRRWRLLLSSSAASQITDSSQLPSNICRCQPRTFMPSFPPAAAPAGRTSIGIPSTSPAGRCVLEHCLPNAHLAAAPCSLLLHCVI